MVWDFQIVQKIPEYIFWWKCLECSDWEFDAKELGRLGGSSSASAISTPISAWLYFTSTREKTRINDERIDCIRGRCGKNGFGQLCANLWHNFSRHTSELRSLVNIWSSSSIRLELLEWSDPEWRDIYRRWLRNSRRVADMRWMMSGEVTYTSRSEIEQLICYLSDSRNRWRIAQTLTTTLSEPLDGCRYLHSQASVRTPKGPRRDYIYSTQSLSKGFLNC